MSDARPFVLPYAGVEPEVEGAWLSCGPMSAVLGRVTIGADPWLGPHAVIRADGHFVRIGRGFRLGRRSTVHIAHDRYPAIVGNDVLVGTNSVVHACTIGSGCILADDVVVLDGSVVEDDVVIESGAVVYPRSRLPGGFVYEGSPAKPVRPLGPAEVADRAARLRHAGPDRDEAPPPEDGAPGGDVDRDATAFVARTARVRGRVRACENTSVFFSCDLDAGDGEIVVGPNTNVQDNTLIRAAGGSVLIGRDTTIGHNVRLTDCRVGERALVGIGAVVHEGTVVEDDVFVAAGAWTTPGQVLESGWLWGGRPARPLARLDDAKRDLILWIVQGYREYARLYKAAQDERA